MPQQPSRHTHIRVSMPSRPFTVTAACFFYSHAHIHAHSHTGCFYYSHLPALCRHSHSLYSHTHEPEVQWLSPKHTPPARSALARLDADNASLTVTHLHTHIHTRTHTHTNIHIAQHIFFCLHTQGFIHPSSPSPVKDTSYGDTSQQPATQHPGVMAWVCPYAVTARVLSHPCAPLMMT